MTYAFETVLNMSISSLWLILAVLCARFVLIKAPKWTRMMLWALVAVRLVMPFTPESPLSLVPETEPVELSVITYEEQGEEWPQEQPMTSDGDAPGVGQQVTVTDPAPETPMLPVTPEVPVTPVLPTAPDLPEADPPAAVTDEKDEKRENDTVAEEQGTAEKASLSGTVLTVAWIVGMVLMVGYFVFCYIRLRLHLRDAVHTEGRVWRSDRIDSAFVFGFVDPRVYIPFNMSERNVEHVIAHEQAHIRRGDHIIKPLAYLILALHWFNPAVWVAYILFCKDVELACDEAVVRGMDAEKKNEYSHALVSLSTEKRAVSVYPLSFGEVGIKSRLKSILDYKKPALWMVIGAVVVCVIVAVCFMTVRGDKETGATADSTEQTESADGTESTDETEESTDGTEEPTDTTDPTEPTEEDGGTFVPMLPVDDGDGGPYSPEYKYVASESKPTGDRVDFEQILVMDDNGVDPLGRLVGVTAEIQNTTETFEYYTKCYMGFDFIYTYDELQTALDEYGVKPDGTHDFAELYDYGEELFEDKVLVSTFRSFSAGRLNYGLEGIYKDGNVLSFYISTDVYRSGMGYPDVIAGSVRVYEIDKTVLDGIDTVSLYVEDMDTAHQSPMPGSDGGDKEPNDDLPVTFDEPKYNYIPCYTRPNGTAIQPNTVYVKTGYSSEPFGKPSGVTTEIQCTDEPLDIYRRCYMGFDFIYTYEELQAAIKEYKAYNGNNVDLSAFERFDEEYFEEHVLVSTYRIFSSGSLKYSVSGIFKNGSNLTFYITTDMYRSNGNYAYLTMVAHSVMVLEMSRSALDGVDTVSLYAEYVNGNTVEPPRGDTEKLTFDVANSETMPEGESVGYSVELNTDAEVPNSLKWDNTVVGTIDERTSGLFVRMNHHTLTGSGESVSQALKNINCGEFAEMAEKYDAEYFKDKVLFLLCQDTAKRRINVTSVVKSGNDLYIRVSVNRNIIVQEKNVILLELDRDVVKTVDTVYYYAESCNEHYCDGDHLIAPATCTEPVYCMLCGKEQGKPLGHGEIIDAGCTTNGVCSRCGIVVENTSEHDLSNNICQRSGCGERGVIYDNVLYGKASSSYTEYELGHLLCQVALSNKYTLSGKSAAIEIKVNNELVHWGMSRVRGYADGALTDLGSVKLSDDGKSIIIPFTGEGEYLIDICYGAADMPYTTTVSVIVGS